MTDEFIDSEFFEGYDVLPPAGEDYDSYEAYSAAYEAWYAGLLAYARRKQEEFEASQPAALEKEAQEEEEPHQTEAVQEGEQLPEDLESSDRYSVGSYIDAAGNVWSPTGELLSGDGSLTGSYTDEAGHLWSMEYSESSGVQAIVEGEIATGEPAIDTALLLLDLIDALTGEDGTTDDVDGMRQVLEHPLLTTSFQDYTVTEGLLLLLLLSVFVAACARMLKEGFAWLR